MNKRNALVAAILIALTFLFSMYQSASATTETTIVAVGYPPVPTSVDVDYPPMSTIVDDEATVSSTPTRGSQSVISPSPDLGECIDGLTEYGFIPCDVEVQNLPATGTSSWLVLIFVGLLLFAVGFALRFSATAQHYVKTEGDHNNSK